MNINEVFQTRGITIPWRPRCWVRRPLCIQLQRQISIIRLRWYTRCPLCVQRLRHRAQLSWRRHPQTSKTIPTFPYCLNLRVCSCQNEKVSKSIRKSKVILYYTNDKRTCLHTINKLQRRIAQVPARRPGITTGFSQARKRSCHTTALCGCNQPHEAYNLVGIHQMAPPSTRLVNKPSDYLFIDPVRMKGWVGLVGWPVAGVYPHSGHPSAAGRAQDRVSSPADDRRSANCATQPTNQPTNQHTARVKKLTAPVYFSLVSTLADRFLQYSAQSTLRKYATQKLLIYAPHAAALSCSWVLVFSVSNVVFSGTMWVALKRADFYRAACNADAV